MSIAIRRHTRFPRWLNQYLAASLVFCLFSWGSTGFAEPFTHEPSSPSQVVERWLSVYPTDLKEAATLTTSNLRKGLSQQEWIDRIQGALADLGFRYLGGRVLSETVEEKTATVFFQSHHATILGEQIQEERYRLRKSADGRWLIDVIEVLDERFLGHPL